ncbi:MAG: ECF-type sigma factor [Planctomycetota bacterium]
MQAENESDDSDSGLPVAAGNLTELLQVLPRRQDELYEFVYSHLKAIARNRLSTENREKTLQTTDLVNEAYLRLSRQNTSWRDRRHFYGVAAEAMRRILIDAARSRKRAKRGGDAVQQPLSGVSLPSCEWESDLLELHDALTELERESPENAEIIQLRFFSGLTCQECADLLEVSVSTVERRWRFARAWLRSKMQEKE